MSTILLGTFSLALHTQLVTWFAPCSSHSLPPRLPRVIMDAAGDELSRRGGIQGCSSRVRGGERGAPQHAPGVGRIENESQTGTPTG